MNFARIDSVNAPYVPLAVADGREAVKYVRQHASEYGVEPNKIGMIGFSAGGTVVVSVAQTYDKESRPDFVAPIYTYCSAILGDIVPTDAPPMFLAFAADDPISNGNTRLYEKWRDAGKSVEMYAFPKGGHGFGMATNNQLTNEWTFRLDDWLLANGFSMPLSPKMKSYNIPLQSIYKMLKGYWQKTGADWAEFGRYEKQNGSLGLPEKGENRVVFMGNSITDSWQAKDSSFFKGRPYIDRGIGGQTTDQMLVRFHSDVIALNPSVVVIMAGTNDNMQKQPLQHIVNNIISMAELAKVNNIKVVLCSITPATYPLNSGMNLEDNIPILNDMIKAYALKNKIVYVDYYPALANDKGGMKHELTLDGIHPELAGYKIMESLVKKAITATLKRK